MPFFELKNDAQVGTAIAQRQLPSRPVDSKHRSLWDVLCGTIWRERPEERPTMSQIVLSLDRWMDDGPEYLKVVDDRSDSADGEIPNSSQSMSMAGLQKQLEDMKRLLEEERRQRQEAEAKLAALTDGTSTT